MRRARALFCAYDGKREKRGKDEAGKSPICAVLGGRVQRLWACRVTWPGREPVGCSLQPLVPRVPERSGGLVSAGNCWLLGKLYCQVRHCIGGSVGNVGRHSEFTNVYRAAQQGNGRGRG